MGEILARFAEARVLGVTATPERLDGKGLGLKADGFFDALVHGTDRSRACRASGYLSQAGWFSRRRVLSTYPGIRTVAGDYAARAMWRPQWIEPVITGDRSKPLSASHCQSAPAIVVLLRQSNMPKASQRLSMVAGFQGRQHRRHARQRHPRAKDRGSRKRPAQRPDVVRDHFSEGTGHSRL
jgi:hypothetical protein